MTVSIGRDTARHGRPPALGVPAQLAVLGALAVTVGLGPAGLVTGAIFTAATWLLLTRALSKPDVQRWGPADTVTFGRLILTGGVLALAADAVAGTVHHLTLIGLAAASLLLDAVDGQVARRTGTASRFGARFDMEADSILAVTLSVYLATGAGWWAVSLGLFRYAFVLATWAQPWLAAPLAPRFSRKVVAAFQGVVLVVTSAGLLPVTAARVLIGVSLAALVWSFALDVRRLWQRRRAAAVTAERRGRLVSARPATS